MAWLKHRAWSASAAAIAILASPFGTAFAGGDDQQAHTLRELEAQTASLKRQALGIARDLDRLKSTAIEVPANQVVVFLSLDADRPPRHDAVEVELLIDNTVVATHSYAPGELAALRKGGLHRLYEGNITQGDHRLAAHFKFGQRPEKASLPHKAAVDIVKKRRQKRYVIELSQRDAIPSPKVDFNEWQEFQP